MTARRLWAVAGAAAALLAVAVPAVANGGGGGRPAAVTVRLTARHSRFEPATVTVPAGATVRFVVRNLDPIDHEFIVGGPEVHQHHEVGRDAHHHGDVAGEVSVPAGTTATTTWTAPAAGRVVFACHLPGHFAYGMRGVVVISS
ncbi:MAG TPA: cupredoxin domain-containing protein [Acidimicrobiales bacterium]|nr:cupredoxin domain-containing protein [Acidimicrobiales bacterium]